jgi:hypothetical protein
VARKRKNKQPKERFEYGQGNFLMGKDGKLYVLKSSEECRRFCVKYEIPYRNVLENISEPPRAPISHRAHFTSTARARRFVRTDFPLTIKEKYAMRDKGIFPIEEVKGETTRFEGVRLDTETEKQLRLMMLWHKEKTGKEPTLSDLIRLCIHREFVRQEQHRKTKN